MLELLSDWDPLSVCEVLMVAVIEPDTDSDVLFEKAVVLVEDIEALADNEVVWVVVIVCEAVVENDTDWLCVRLDESEVVVDRVVVRD